MATTTTIGFAPQTTYIQAPTQIPGCALWLDAADASTLTLSGANVTTWNDKSGYGRNAVGSTGTGTYSTGIINGLNVVNIVPTGNMRVPIASGTFSTAITAFVIFKTYGTPSTYNTIISRATASLPSPVDLYSTTSATFRVIGNGTTYTNNFQNVVTVCLQTNPTLYMLNVASAANTTWNEYLNGTLTTYTTAGGTGASYGDTATNLYIGNRGDGITLMTGYIGEIIAFNTTITTTQRQQIEGYLAWKWGLQASLPTNHPFFRASPAYFGTLPLTSYMNFAPQTTYIQAPTQIPGCALWLDAADASTLTLSGANVTQWNDKSGNGNNAIQGTTAFQPTYTNKSIFIANNSNYLSFTNLSILSNVSYASVFMVYNLSYISANPGRMHIFYADGSNSGQDRLSMYVYSTTGPTPNSYTGVVARAADSGSITFADGTVNTAVGVNTIINGEVNYAGNQINDYINGSIYKTASLGTTTNTAATNSKNIRIGGIGTGDTANPVYIFETLLYTTALTTTQRQQIEGYLAWKWGLQASLPTNHPFFRASPAYFGTLPTKTYLSLTIPKWKPTQIPGCALWLDAADASTLTLSGANVTTWKDKSGNGYDAIQPTSAAQPTYVSQSVYFGSNSQYMYFQGAALTMTQNVGFCSCFLVFVLNGTQVLGQRTYILATTTGTGGARFGMFLDNTGSAADQTVTKVGFFGRITDAGGSTGFQAPSASNNVLTLTNVEMNYTNNTGTIYTNGSNIASASNLFASGGNTTNTASTAAYLNGSPGNNGVSVYEMIFFNQAFTTAQRQQIEGYLAWKWGLATSLPNGHQNQWMPPT